MTTYVAMPPENGGADLTLVTFNQKSMMKPSCVRHGAMNKVTPSPPGWWRCLHISGCRAGCAEEPS